MSSDWFMRTKGKLSCSFEPVIPAVKRFFFFLYFIICPGRRGQRILTDTARLTWHLGPRNSCLRRSLRWLAGDMSSSSSSLGTCEESWRARLPTDTLRYGVISGVHENMMTYRRLPTVWLVLGSWSVQSAWVQTNITHFLCYPLCLLRSGFSLVLIDLKVRWILLFYQRSGWIWDSL